MQLIQNGSQGPTTLPTKQVAVGTPGFGYGGPPGATPSSIWDADVANTILAELANIVTAAGMSLDPTDNSQVLKALRRTGFPTGLGVLSVSTTLTGAANAGNFYNVGGSATTQTLNAATFTPGQTIGFLAQAACTITTNSGIFYGGLLTGSSFAMPEGGIIALEWDGINWKQLAGSFSASVRHVQVFTSSGTFTWPAGVTQAKVTVVGGGGEGGTTGATVSQAAAGGGAGGTAIKWVTGVTPGTSTTVTVGAGGSGATAGSPGNNGGTSSFGSFCSATGGAGGATATTGLSIGPTSGAGAGGDLTIRGGAGSDGQSIGVGIPGAGGNSIFGGGGRGGTISNDARMQGTAYGAGGGGAYSAANISGGQGAPGIVIVEY